MSEAAADKQDERPRTIWDNDLPVGDSPPLPRWPLIVSIVVCCAWAVFLVSMMVLRLNHTH